MVQRLWIWGDRQRQHSGRKMGEVSLNQLDAMSEYDQYVLQGNSTQTSLSIPWPFSRRLVTLQVGGFWTYAFATCPCPCIWQTRIRITPTLPNQVEWISWLAWSLQCSFSRFHSPFKFVLEAEPENHRGHEASSSSHCTRTMDDGRQSVHILPSVRQDAQTTHLHLIIVLHLIIWSR